MFVLLLSEIVPSLDHRCRVPGLVDGVDAMLRHLTELAVRSFLTTTGRRDFILHGEAIHGGH